MKSLVSSESRAAASSGARLYILFVVSLIMIGCSSAPTFMKPDFERKQIRSIAVMPVTDKRTSAEDKVNSGENISIIEKLLVEKITDKHYDVVPPASVLNILKVKTNQNISHADLASELKVDGILFSELYDYTDIFFINHSIKMNFKIYDAYGDSLWINDLDENDSPFLTALGASLGWAIGVAVDSKTSSNNKLPTILAGAAAAELIYAAVDGLTDETSQSIDKAFRSLPDAKGSVK